MQKSFGDLFKGSLVLPRPPPGTVIIEVQIVSVRRGGIVYTIDGTWKNLFYYGRTSMDSEIWDDDNEEISIIPFDSPDEARQYASVLRYLENPFIISPRFVHQNVIREGTAAQASHVIVEKINADLESFMAKKLGEMPKSSGWWKFCENDFKKIFRGIMLVYWHIISQTEKTFEIPKLLNPGVVPISAEGAPKLALVQESCVLVNREKEVTDLGKTMSRFLEIGASNMAADTDWELKLKHLEVSEGVIQFVRDCFQWTSNSNMNIQWLLDSSCMWDYGTIIKWVYKLSKKISEWTGDAILRQTLDTYIRPNFPNGWTQHIPQKGRTKEVLDFFLEEQRKYQKNTRKQYHDFWFFNLAKFFQHMLEHFDNPFASGAKLGKEGICELVESFYPDGLCFLLRSALQDAFFKLGADARWRELLSY